MALQLEISTSNEWHVLKGNSQYGPYTYEQMLSLLQEKTLFSFDYVWSPHMATWVQLADLAEFSADRIAPLVKKDTHAQVFIPRAHPRAACEWRAYIHNNEKFWVGKVESVSLGGALVLMENPLLLPGDVLTLQITKSIHIQKTFNSRGEVLSKRLTKDRLAHDSQIYYALKFNEIQTAGKEQIQAYIETQLKGGLK